MSVEQNYINGQVFLSIHWTVFLIWTGFSIQIYTNEIVEIQRKGPNQIKPVAVEEYNTGKTFINRSD